MTSGRVVSLEDLTPADWKNWKQLVEQAHLNPSLDPDWLQITARSHGVLEKAKVLLAGKETEPSTYVPFIVTQDRELGFPVKTLRLISNYVSYHNAMITQETESRCLGRLLSLAKVYGCHRIQLSNIPSDTALAKGVAVLNRNNQALVYTISGENCPYLLLESSWKELLASKAKKFRYKVRKRAEALQSSDSLTMRWFTEPGDWNSLLSAMEKIEANSWKQKAGISLFAREHEREYHEQLLPFLGKEGALYANVLYLRDQPIAYNLCCFWNGWMGQLKTSFDLNHGDLSPGATVIDSAIEKAIELGAYEFDFLGEADRHKLLWTKSVRTHIDYYLYPASSIAGTSLAKIKLLRRKIGSWLSK